MRVSCHEKNFTYEIGESQKLNYEENCNVFKISSVESENFSEGSSIEINFEYKRPNFSMYDNILKDWKYDISEIDRRNNKFNEILNDTQALLDEANLKKFLDSTKESTETSFFNFENLFNDIKDSLVSFFLMPYVQSLIKMLLILYVILPIVGFCVVWKLSKILFCFVFCKQKRK